MSQAQKPKCQSDQRVVRKLILIVFLIFAQGIPSAQSMEIREKRVDSIQSVNEDNKPTTAKLRILAMAAYDEGDTDKALGYLKQATILHPNDQLAWYNHGNTGSKIALKFKQQGLLEEIWMPIANEAEQALKQTLVMAKREENVKRNRKFIGSISLHLGNLHHYVYERYEQARDYYEFSKRHWSENDQLNREIETINKKVDPSYVPKTVDLKYLNSQK